MDYRDSARVGFASLLFGLAVFGLCLGAAAVVPGLKQDFFCRPAAHLASFFLNAPVSPTPGGWVLEHPRLDVRVVEACSGYDFFALLFAVLCGIALRHGGRWQLILFLPVSYAVAVLANTARVICAVHARVLADFAPIGLPDEVIHLAVGAGIFTTILMACCHAMRLIYEHDSTRPA